jgi:hypothetical protein
MVEKSASGLKDKATIELPLAKGLANKEKPLDTVANWLKEGERVRIFCKYEKLGEIWETDEFTGYVMRIHPTVPAKIECQDSSYLMERTELNESFKNTSIKAVVQRLLNLTNAKFNSSLKLAFEVQDIPVQNQFRASNTNCLFALDSIRKNYGLQAYFKNDTLYVGLAYTRLSNTRNVKVNLRGQIVNHDLVYTTDDSQKLVITAIGFNQKGLQRKVTVPDGVRSGFDRKITLVNPKRQSEEALRNWAKAQLGKKRFEGFTGSVTCFLIPEIYPNDTIEIIDEDNLERNGNYLVEATKLTKGKGIRRVITIGNKI